jgi:Di-haem cytochrome c peroxidase
MRMVLGGALAAILAVVAAPASADDLMKKAQENFKPIPSVVPSVKDNAVTHEKVELGKLLFFDPRLSASEIISCNTCHNLGTGGVDAGPTLVGHGWQKGPRRAPTVYNAVFNVAQFWDGRAADLKAQAKGPVQASVEMNATPDHHNGINVGGQFGVVENPGADVLPSTDKGRFNVSKTARATNMCSAPPRCATSRCARPTSTPGRSGASSRRSA